MHLAWVLCLLISSPVWAADTLPAVKEEWQKRREEIAEMRAKARQMRTDATHAFDVASEKCHETLFSAGKCVEAAAQIRIAAEKEASRIEKDALRIEKAIRDETRAEKKAHREERTHPRQPASSRSENQGLQNKDEPVRTIEKSKPDSPADVVAREQTRTDGQPAPNTSPLPARAGREAPTNWEQVGASDTIYLFADRMTIRREGSRATMAHLVDYKLRPPENGVSYQSSVVEAVYDCKENRFRDLSASFHPFRMGEGRPLSSVTYADGWMAIPTGSGAALLGDIACERGKSARKQQRVPASTR